MKWLDEEMSDEDRLLAIILCEKVNESFAKGRNLMIPKGDHRFFIWYKLVMNHWEKFQRRYILKDTIKGYRFELHGQKLQGKGKASQKR